MEYKVICLEINGKKCVKLESGTIKCKNHFKQIAVTFNIYADFESLLKKLQINDRDKNTSHTEKYQDHVSCSFAYKSVCIVDKFSKPPVLCSGKIVVNRLIETIFEEYDYSKKVIRKYFNKNLFISVEDERRFQSSNKCWICNTFFTDEDKKVRDHDHVTGKYRGTAHSSGNISLKLTKNVSVIFRNLRGYDSFLIMKEINRFDVEISVIPNDQKNIWLLQLI